MLADDSHAVHVATWRGVVRAEPYHEKKSAEGKTSMKEGTNWLHIYNRQSKLNSLSPIIISGWPGIWKYTDNLVNDDSNDGFGLLREFSSFVLSMFVQQELPSEQPRSSASKPSHRSHSVEWPEPVFWSQQPRRYPSITGAQNLFLSVLLGWV